MSRFTNLKNHLSFSEALKIYFRLKIKNRKNIRISKLKYPFTIRNNPFDYGSFEEVVVKEAYNIPIDFAPRYIIDGGGNIGLTAAFFATKYPDAVIVSVEPDEGNFDLLQKNVAPYKNIKPMKGGIWYRSAFLLVKDLGWGNNGFMVEETAENTQEAIEAYSITEIMQKMNWTQCDIVKLDVEGSEKEIFSADYESWLPKTKVLIVELHDRMKKGCSKAVFSAISKYNFSFSIAGENMVFTNEGL